MKKLFLMLILVLPLVSCQRDKRTGFRDYTEVEKITRYIEGAGYCVTKYDDLGCNYCGLSYIDSTWKWFCTQKLCYGKDGEIGNKEKANQCTQYLSKEELKERYKLK